MEKRSKNSRMEISPSSSASKGSSRVCSRNKFAWVLVVGKPLRAVVTAVHVPGEGGAGPLADVAGAGLDGRAFSSMSASVDFVGETDAGGVSLDGTACV